MQKRDYLKLLVNSGPSTLVVLGTLAVIIPFESSSNNIISVVVGGTAIATGVALMHKQLKEMEAERIKRNNDKQK